MRARCFDVLKRLRRLFEAKQFKNVVLQIVINKTISRRHV